MENEKLQLFEVKDNTSDGSPDVRDREVNIEKT